MRVADSVFRNNENNFEGDDTFFARGGVMCVEAGSLSLERVEMYNNTAGKRSIGYTHHHVCVFMDRSWVVRAAGSY